MSKQTKDNQSGIYTITHTESGRQYVGSAVSIASRWANHRQKLIKSAHHSVILQRAWDKYGADAFEFSVLEVVEDKTRLLEREQVWIDGLRPYFNVNPTAGSNLGRTWSAETRARMSAGLKDREFSPEHRARLSEAAKSRSAEHRAKIAEANRAKAESPEFRRKLSEALTGRTLSDEHRAAVSAARKGRECTPEETVRLREIATHKRPNRKCSPEQIERLRAYTASIKGVPLSPEQREQRRQAATGRTHSPETRAKISAARQAHQSRLRDSGRVSATTGDT